LTAAHPTLPFGSKIKVTNLGNGKSVEVEITDRGPFGGNRIIDLSQAAAKALDMIDSGTATVRLEQSSSP
jgi:rare lipoprotein A